MAGKDDVAIGGLDATFTDVALPFGLTLNRVHITSGAATLGSDPFSIRLDEPGQVEVSLSEAYLQAFLNRKAPGGLKDFQIRLDKGEVLVEASLKLFIEVRASAVCTLRIENGTQIWVDLIDVNVLGVGAKSLVQSHLEKMNPVVDVADFPFQIHLEQAAINAGQLLLTGTASPK